MGWQWYNTYASTPIRLDGRLFTGPSDKAHYVYFGMIVIVCAYLTMFCINHHFQDQESLILFYLIMVVFLSNTYNYLACCFKDPGIILRGDNYLET